MNLKLIEKKEFDWQHNQSAYKAVQDAVQSVNAVDRKTKKY